MAEAGPQDVQEQDGRRSRRSTAEQGPLGDHAPWQHYPVVRVTTDGHDSDRVKYPAIGASGHPDTVPRSHSTEAACICCMEWTSSRHISGGWAEGPLHGARRCGEARQQIGRAQKGQRARPVTA